MKINLKQAVRYFFPNPSLELVYIEAVANSIDAGATEISIAISIEEINKPNTLKVVIKDNGVGFTDERYAKFSKLLQVEENSHKGIGRLVFLSYFEIADIISSYGSSQRTFQYSTDFDGERNEVVNLTDNPQETKISFSSYFLSKIGKLDFIKPEHIRNRLLEEFYPKLYLLKRDHKLLSIRISLNIEIADSRFENTYEEKIISLDEIAEFEIEPINADMLEMFQKMELHYSIVENSARNTLITALCIDERTYKLEIIADENIPFGYEIIFLLYSSFFDGKVSASRQELTLTDSDLKAVKKLFQAKVAEILKKKIPVISENNEKVRKSLIDTYPHLQGYFEVDTIGFIKREDTIKRAQDKFFKDQREVLEASSVSDEMFKKSLDLSARVLTEYVLYRQITLEKLKKINPQNNEADIHNLIVPKGKSYAGKDFMNHLYSNNAWLLDDKYMSYSTILSDKTTSEIIKAISDEDESRDSGEPDIAIIFSNNPETSIKVDVVVVELKRLGLKLEDKVTAVVQLQKRATKLMAFYPHKIQRIWFYAIVDFNDEFQLYLQNNKFISLFSTDTLYYREDEIKTSLNARESSLIGLYVLSYEAFIKDADVRNSTFLKILKESFKVKA